MIPTSDRREVPALITDQVREVDRAMIEDLHIELIQMMENAGRSLAELAHARFAPVTVTVLAAPAVTAAEGWSRPGTWSTAAAPSQWSYPNPIP
jgi:hypothetical protein